MAPERFDGGQSDARADIYALTCVLYECLTGTRPYPGDSLEQQIAGHMVSPPPRPSDVRSGPGGVRRRHRQGHGQGTRRSAIRRAPNCRPPSRGRSNAPVRAYRGRAGTRPAGPAPRRVRSARRPAWRRRCASLLVAVCAFGAWQLRGGRRRRWAARRTATAGPIGCRGAVPSIAATVPADIRCGGPVGDRCQSCPTRPTSSRTPTGRSSDSTST